MGAFVSDRTLDQTIWVQILALLPIGPVNLAEVITLFEFMLPLKKKMRTIDGLKF